MESGVLLAMSVDRFVAIYNPLRYTAILTLPRIAGSAVLGLKSVMLMFPLPLLLKHLPFCGHNVLSHSYCLHSDLIQLPCGNTRPNSILGLCIVTSTLDWTHCSLSSLICWSRTQCWAFLQGGTTEGPWHVCLTYLCGPRVLRAHDQCGLRYRLWSRLPLLVCSWPTSIFWCLLCSIPSSTVVNQADFHRANPTFFSSKKIRTCWGNERLPSKHFSVIIQGVQGGREYSSPSKLESLIKLHVDEYVLERLFIVLYSMLSSEIVLLSVLSTIYMST